MHLLRRVLKIRPGEEATAFRLLALMFVAWAGAAVGASAVESLFFARFGTRNLPYMYILVGVVTFPATLGITALLVRRDRYRALVTLLLTLGVVVLALRGLLVVDARWVYPLLFLGMMVAWTALGIATWGLAGSVHDTRQAKRLFPLYGAGAILGGAVGGLATKSLAALLHAENLLFVWAVSLGGAFLLAASVGDRARDRRRRLPGPRPERAGLPHAVFQGARYVRRSPLAMWMSVTVVSVGLLYFSLSLPFAEAATARFPDPDRLAGFLGLFTGAANVVALILSLGVANRLFARFGVPTLVLTLPVVYLVGFGVLAVEPGFAPLVTFRFFQWVWMFGVWTTAWQALRAVIPSEWREQVRAFLDGGPMQLGVVLAGLLLLATEDSLSSRQFFLVAAALSTAAVGASWFLRRSYSGALVDALRAGHPEVFVHDEEPFGGQLLDRAAQSTVAAGARDPEPVVRRLAVNILAEVPSDDHHELFLERLEDRDGGVRLAALRAIERSPSSEALPTVLGLLEDLDPRIRAAAADAVMACSAQRTEDAGRLRPLLQDPDVHVRLRTAAALVRAADDPEARTVLRGLAASPDPAEHAATLATLGELRLEPDLVTAGLRDEDPLVRSAAARAIPAFGVSTAAEPLLAALREDDPGVREAVAGSLVSLGDDIAAGLAEALHDGRSEATALAAMVRLPNTDPSILRQYSLLERDRALHYHGAWQSLSGSDQDRIAPLVMALRHRALRHAEHAVHALAPFGDHVSVDVALENLASRDASQRANAVETLDTLSEPLLVRRLVPVWEPQAEPRPGGVEVLRSLLADDDPWIRACAAFAAGTQDDAELRGEVEALARDDPDPAVRESARQTLRGGVVLETLPTLSLMEKVLHLGRVPLFRELSPADLKQVAETATENAYVDGTVIADQGDPGDAMHVVVSGDVGVLMGEGTASEVARRGPGYIVGEMAVVAEQPRMASLVAVGHVRTLSIDRTRFQRILRERPDAALAVMRELVARLQEAHRSGPPAAGS